MHSNVPYLAWRGEQVRLVKCSGDLSGEDVATLRSADVSPAAGLQFKLLNADVLVEDWSGPDGFQPKVEQGTVDFFLSSTDGLCLKADVVSQRAGLAMIKMVATFDPGADGSIVDIFTRSEILAKHQFLAGWMNLNTPSLTELPVGGDATHLNTFDAGRDPSDDGQMQVRVSGNLPLGNGFSELGLGDSLTLPDGWPALAAKMAASSDPDNARPQFTWDIHDDQSAVEGHPLFGPVDTTGATSTRCDDHAASADLAPRRDAVDNCDGGLSFSWIADPDGPGGMPASNGLTLPDTIGPFDPQRPDETFLGDGNLTADDAPMPSARVDVSIAPGGPGSLVPADKSGVYNRARPAASNGTGYANTDPHNLYAPYYSAYIPATSAPVDEASGVDGPAKGNDFNGFFVNGEYHYWDIAHYFPTVSMTTGCLRRISYGVPDYRVTPVDQSVAVYTDEHGEARVGFRAGVDASFDTLPGVIKNENGGCDLEGVRTLGTAHIDAVAKYPYQTVTDQPKPAATPLDKVVLSHFTKFLAVFPKGAGAENANARIVIAHAQDVDGSPFRYETVCFMNTSASGRIQPFVDDGLHTTTFTGPSGAVFDISGTHVANDPSNGPANDRTCVKTNRYGNAAIEVFESQGAEIDVIADFTDERLLRDVKIPFGKPPVVIEPGSNGGGNGTTPPGSGTLGQVTQGGTQVSAAKPGARKALLRYARYSTSASGKRTLVVRLAGKAKTARIKIRLIGRSGKTLKVATRRVAVGRAVKMTGLRIPAKTARVRISVIG
jgi:hypothetical protein